MGDDPFRRPGWSLVAEYDGAGALIDALLDLDADGTYTKQELSNAADVSFKQLYFDGTMDAVVAAGLVERVGGEGGETLYAIRADSEVYDVARQFHEVTAEPDRLEPA